MADARTERIDNAVASAGELIAALQDEGPVTPRQARVIVFAAVRAAVPNFEEWEVRKSAERIAPVLKVDGAVQLALPLEGANENQSGDVR
jgi:hypothetical protein